MFPSSSWLLSLSNRWTRVAAHQVGGCNFEGCGLLREAVIPQFPTPPPRSPRRQPKMRFFCWTRKYHMIHLKAVFLGYSGGGDKPKNSLGWQQLSHTIKRRASRSLYTGLFRAFISQLTEHLEQARSQHIQQKPTWSDFEGQNSLYYYELKTWDLTVQ